jgi:hypothetical protein
LNTKLIRLKQFIEKESNAIASDEEMLAALKCLFTLYESISQEDLNWPSPVAGLADESAMISWSDQFAHLELEVLRNGNIEVFGFTREKTVPDTVVFSGEQLREAIAETVVRGNDLFGNKILSR